MNAPIRYLLVVGSFCAASAVAVGAPSAQSVEIKITEVLPSGRIVVTVENRQDRPAKLWRESNSWGAARWRVLLVRAGKLETLFQNPNQRFTRNIPSFNEVAGGASIRQELDVNGGNWCSADQCASFDERGIGGRSIAFQPDDEIFIIYDVPRTTEATKLGVWYGVIAARASL